MVRFKDEYVSNKVEKWVQDIEQLSNIAKDEPQSALSSFIRAISHRWTYVQRTAPCTGHLFQPLENVIRKKLIQALVGRSVSDIERRILALPVRLGGIGLSNPVLSADCEYSASASITRNLTNVIYSQDKDLKNYDRVQVENNIKLVKAQKERILQDEYNQLLEEVDVRTKRSMALAREKGSGSWLTALPIKSLGDTLNKRDSRTVFA